MATRGIGRRALFFVWALMVPVAKPNPLDGMRLWA